MAAHSYPLPRRQSHQDQFQNPPRPLLPLHPPPTQMMLPPLPSPPRMSPLDGFSLSTHLVPAAFPRSTPFLPAQAPPRDGQSRTAHKNAIVNLAEEILDHKGQQSNADPRLLAAHVSHTMLWNCVNRYVKLGPRHGSVTLLLLHANGIPKEVWEPTLAHLTNSAAAPVIDEIWAWEAVQHGDAALINADRLGGLFDWSDNSRDILNFLIHYMPPCDIDQLPTHLPPILSTDARHRRASGFSDRKLVVIGQSFSGSCAVQAAATAPSLFSSIILIDPIIISSGNPVAGRPSARQVSRQHVQGALMRRSVWSSRDEAFEVFSQVPFFRVWDLAALTAYIKYGLVDLPHGGVALKQPGLQEAVVFAETKVPEEAAQLVSTLDPRIELRWVMPGPGCPNVGDASPEEMAERVWLRRENTSNVCIDGAGHLIPQQNPSALAAELTQFICRRYGRRRSLL